MRKIIVHSIILFISYATCYAQENVNDYKYVIVPESYGFLKEKDQYQLNSLTKFLFEKYGFTALMTTDDYPEDLLRNRCLALNADVIKDSGVFRTKLQVTLLNCKGVEIFISNVGETREKQYDKAYNLALRDAFVSIRNLNYSYKANDLVTNSNDRIIDYSNDNQLIEVEPNPKVVDNKDIAYKSIEESNIGKQNLIKDIADILYAQPIENGFQIVDTEPKKVMILYYSGVTNVFIVKGRDAIVYKKDGAWIYSVQNGKYLEEKVINLKF